ncbi:MAG: hypothetical protein P4L84_34675 [Isosphaeraceae bacterium]|nr:hypothetical protein [Isosphaeraceae bacterium]
MRYPSVIIAALGRPQSVRWSCGALLAAGLITWTACAASLDNGHVGVVHDDGIYLVSARALRDGLAYGLPNRPGVPRPKYPIGLPILVAAALRIAPGVPSPARDIAVARTVVIASGWIFVLCAYAWLRRLRIGPLAASLIVLAAAFNHVTLVDGAITIFADLPFCAVVYALLARWAGRGAGNRPAGTVADAFGDGLLAGLGLFLRSNGVTLVLGALIAAWIGPRRRATVAACALGISSVALPLTLYPAQPPHPVPSGNYSLEMRAGWSSPAAGMRIIAGNLGSIVRDLPMHVVFPNASYTAAVTRLFAVFPFGAWVIRVVIGVPVALGLARLWRQRRPIDVPAWFQVAATLGLFAIWPWNSVMDRFLLSLFPMVLLCFGTGVAEAARLAGAGRSAVQRAAIASLVLALASNFSVAARSVAQFHSHGRQWAGASDRAELESALAFIATLEPDAVVAATWPETVSLYTGRQAFPLIEDDQLMLRASGDSRRLKRWIELTTSRPCYLLARSQAEDPSSTDLRQVARLASEPGYRLRDVFRSPGGRYRVIVVTKIN